MSQLPLQTQSMVSLLAAQYNEFSAEMAGFLSLYRSVGVEELLIIFDPEYSIKPCHPQH